MNLATYRVSLDVHETVAQAVLPFRKLDSGRTVEFYLHENGGTYVIPERCTAVLRAVKPDGTVLYNYCAINHNVIVYDVTNQTTVLPGVVECDLTLYGPDETAITSPRFVITVDDVLVSDDEVESQDEFTELTEAIAQVANLDIEASKVGKTATVTVTRADGTEEEVEIEDGVSVQSIEKTDTSGLVDTYTITLDDGTTQTFTVTNGNGISSVSKTGTDGLVDTYTVTFTNGTTSTFTVTNGAKGDTGEKGDKGDRGPQGIQGIQGIQGATGAKGDKGDKGEKGDSGTTDHTQLTNRDAADQHPISAITGLTEALAGKGTYSKPSGGIPKTDLASEVKNSLTKADNAQQKEITDAGGYYTTDTVESALQEIGAKLAQYPSDVWTGGSY